VGRAEQPETVIYEVNLEADAAIEAPFDTWLRDHVADMLQLPGFLSAEVLIDASAPAGRVRRTVQYRLRSQPDLDSYLREHAPRMREHGVALFGDRFTAARRVLAHREEFIRGQVSTDNCLNCGEVLTGQHCSHCGQRAKVRVLSLGGLLRDLFGDLTEFDSRIWRTLIPLAFRPGTLTAEYLRGRRTHYTPPFRMYLVLSVVFFLATSVGGNPGDAMRLDVGEGGANLQIGSGSGEQAQSGSTAEGARTATPRTTDPADAGPAASGTATSEAAPGAAGAAPPPAGSPTDGTPAAERERQRVIDAIVDKVPRAERESVRRELEREFGGATPEQIRSVSRIVDDPCGESNVEIAIGSWGEQYEPRLREACRKIVSDSSSFGRALYENIPKMMFIFLPLIAAVMFVLYLGSGRYYVEHLLFFVHYHAFFFLGGLAIVVLDRSSALLEGTAFGNALRFLEGALTFVLVLYVPYYLYRAMRRVYGQGRLVTLAKYSLLGIGYVFFMALTAIGLLFYTALTL
jgi:hypothetical protein